MTRSFVLALPVVLFLAVPAVATPLTVKTLSLERTTNAYETSLTYPETGIKAIDEEIAAWARSTVDDFIKMTAENRQPDEDAYGYDAAFEVARNDDEMFAVDFNELFDAGGAHPSHDVTTFNYLRPDGWRIYLPEIFVPQALQKISALAIARLAKQMDVDADSVKDGAYPNWGNFQDYAVLLRDKLHIDFPQGRVGGYVSGEQEINIPLAELKGLFRKDWRAPVASFDCVKAVAPVEKAICSNVALARIDRDFANAYQEQLYWELDKAGKTKIRMAQEAWLKKRDAACPDAAVPCLTQMYKARLKELQAS
jgi:uncharacterized protein YecT (DUF1311 family)